MLYHIQHKIIKFTRKKKNMVYTFYMEFDIAVLNTEKITWFTRKKIDSAEYQKCMHGHFLDGF